MVLSMFPPQLAAVGHYICAWCRSAGQDPPSVLLRATESLHGLWSQSWNRHLLIKYDFIMKHVAVTISERLKQISRKDGTFKETGLYGGT